MSLLEQIRRIVCNDWGALPKTPKLPSVPSFAVGKISGTRQTIDTWQLHVQVRPSTSVSILPECHMLTHGKPTYMPSVTLRHSATHAICRVSPSDTRQTNFFLILPPKLFVLLYYNTCCSVLKFCTFLSDFTIFRQFILVK